MKLLGIVNPERGPHPSHIRELGHVQRLPGFSTKRPAAAGQHARQQQPPAAKNKPETRRIALPTRLTAKAYYEAYRLLSTYCALLDRTLDKGLAERDNSEKLTHENAKTSMTSGEGVVCNS